MINGLKGGKAFWVKHLKFDVIWGLRVEGHRRRAVYIGV